MAAATHPVHCLRRPGAAATLLQPLRLRIVAALREPDSASGVARRLGIPRQKVNYHMRELARAGCLRRAGQRRVRNMTERRYVATARAFVLAPQILGKLAADHGRIADRFSLAYLLAMTSQVQADLVRVTELAAEQGKRVATLSIATRLRFENPEQRARFALELQRAIVDVIGRFASPDSKDDGTPASGRPYRLVLGCYPAPPEEHRAPRPKETPQ
jgi:DNA-binding transcriptional ArsR family regulator